MQSPWQGAGRGSPCHLPCHLPPCPGSRAGCSGKTEAASTWEGAAPPFPGMWRGQGRAHLRMAAGGISVAVGKIRIPLFPPCWSCSQHSRCVCGALVALPDPGDRDVSAVPADPACNLEPRSPWRSECAKLKMIKRVFLARKSFYRVFCFPQSSRIMKTSLSESTFIVPLRCVSTANWALEVVMVFKKADNLSTSG